MSDYQDEDYQALYACGYYRMFGSRGNKEDTKQGTKRARDEEGNKEGTKRAHDEEGIKEGNKK